jgi:beta propeller repeat protein
MKTIRITLLALILGVILSTYAFSEQVWNEQRITNTPWAEAGPVLTGDDKIYYNDRRSGHGEVYVYDQAQGSRMLIGGDTISRAVWGVSGNTLVTTRFVNSQYDLYLWDAVNGERPINTAAGDQRSASIFGDTVVYENWESGRPQVFMYDPINGNRALFPSNTWQENPKISSTGRVVWDDSQFRTYMWTAEGGAVNLGSGISPAVYEDKVVNWTLGYYAFDNGWYIVPGYLNAWTPAGGWKTLAQHTMTEWSDVIGTQVWGDLVVWQTRVDLAVVQAWDPAHGFSIVDQSTFGWTPSVYGNRVAWAGEGAERRTDIYLSTMVPEPSSILALAGGIGFFLLRERRKRRR